MHPDCKIFSKLVTFSQYILHGSPQSLVLMTNGWSPQSTMSRLPRGNTGHNTFYTEYTERNNNWRPCFAANIIQSLAFKHKSPVLIMAQVSKWYKTSFESSGASFLTCALFFRQFVSLPRQTSSSVYHLKHLPEILFLTT